MAALCGPHSKLIVLDIDDFHTISTLQTVIPERDRQGIPWYKTNRGLHLWYAWDERFRNAPTILRREGPRGSFERSRDLHEKNYGGKIGLRDVGAGPTPWPPARIIPTTQSRALAAKESGKRIERRDAEDAEKEMDNA